MSLRDAERAYPMSPRTRWALRLTVAGFVLFPALLVAGGLGSGDSSLVATGIIVAVIMAPFAVWLLVAGEYPRLIVTPEEIKERKVGRAARVAWDNVTGVLVRPRAEGLILREPVDEPWARAQGNWSGMTYAGSPLFTEEQRQLMVEQRYFPLRAYSHWLRHGDLLQVIGQHAPGATAQDADWTAYEQQRNKDRKVLILVFGITGLLMAGAIVFGLYLADAPEEQVHAYDRVIERLGVVGMWLIGAAISVYALINVRSAWRNLRQRRFGPAALWGALAVVQACIVLAIAAGAF